MTDLSSVIHTVVSTTTGQVTSTLNTNLPLIAVIFGGLVALGLLLHFVHRMIGRRA